ncbi:radical SAM protein [Desulforhabdus amnigena]|uniref:Radical SAM protein n=1 Tax=Desulforhabdus amnigena TaxID=40218 RepID=A0A9W6D4S9_9BACT|nr:radical SAM protein [Desulforhabdus amnigena]NLJ28777.1 radical SAM protein [Deltaproteobacteria bacterium]GLI34167.1 radical SAM protein [Desulforhabdus amnigena]
MPAAYLEAYRNGRLSESIHRSLQWMTKCTLCPRLCRVNRMKGETGYCRTGRYAIVASYGPHFGEEKPLVGRRGSGTIFISYCNLGCVFCQNYEISHGGEGRPVKPDELADMMVSLQEGGCHNINIVTPSHVIPQILEALPPAIERGLRIPLVYNTGGYDRVSALKLLDGIVDIYMPDFKFWDPEVSKRLSNAPDYPHRAREALREMHRQVGDLQLDSRGIAERGLLVRHLVMPGGLAGTASVLHFIAREISIDTYVNIMSQYYPCGEAVGMPDIGRTITAEEFEEALKLAQREGLKRLDERHRHWISLEF